MQRRSNYIYGIPLGGCARGLYLFNDFFFFNPCITASLRKDATLLHCVSCFLIRRRFEIFASFRFSPWRKSKVQRCDSPCDTVPAVPFPLCHCHLTPHVSPHCHRCHPPRDRLHSSRYFMLFPCAAPAETNRWKV